MPYATQLDYTQAFGEPEMIQLTNLDDPNAVAVDAAILLQNQQMAVALIDGMIAACPSVAAAMPFASPYPELLIHLEMDICRYFLDRFAAREDVRQRYEDALATLKLIGKCQLSLGLVNGAVEAPTAGSAATQSRVRVFTDPNMRDF